jgi:hypothetical protein
VSSRELERWPYGATITITTYQKEKERERNEERYAYRDEEDYEVTALRRCVLGHIGKFYVRFLFQVTNKINQTIPNRHVSVLWVNRVFFFVHYIYN